MTYQATPKNIDADAILAEFEALPKPNSKAKSNGDENQLDSFPNLLKLQTANKWLDDAKTRPVPKMLFGELWFEGELCIFFADTNLGKSILAVQIGDGISKGEDIGQFKVETDKQKVLYLDFELSDKQFEIRYSEKDGTRDFFTNHYKFDENFIRAEINREAEMDHGFPSFEDYLNNSLKYVLADTNAKVLIIDNLTYLKNDNEKAKDALPLMKHLKALKEKFSLSILILAHTPKRDLSKELSVNDLSGSKVLMNFIDSSFAIGKSAKDEGLRYIKQIKERNLAKKYGANNVALCQIEKPSNFLHFEFDGFGRESEHLRIFTEKDRTNLIEKAKELHGKNLSYSEIAKELGIGKSTVHKYLNL